MDTPIGTVMAAMIAMMGVTDAAMTETGIEIAIVIGIAIETGIMIADKHSEHVRFVALQAKVFPNSSAVCPW